MKLLLAIIFVTTLVSAQQPSRAVRAPERQSRTAQPQQADVNTLWQAELPNLKSDLAELRSMLNVMASQESSLDLRSSGAFQTNRKMWQVVIARLAELTQRMDALERAQGQQLPKPRPEQP